MNTIFKALNLTEPSTYGGFGLITFGWQMQAEGKHAIGSILIVLGALSVALKEASSK